LRCFSFAQLLGLSLANNCGFVWGFDSDDKLIEVVVEKGKDAI